MAEGRTRSRRELLAAVTGVATVGFAGCSDGGTSDSSSDDGQGNPGSEGNQTAPGGENGQETESRPPEITVDWNEDVSINPYNQPTALELGTIDSEGSFAYDVSVGGETVAEELGFSDQNQTIRIGSSAISELPTAPGNYTLDISGLENEQDTEEGELTVEGYLSINTPERAVTVAPGELAEVETSAETNRAGETETVYKIDGEVVSTDFELTYQELAQILEPGNTAEVTAEATVGEETATGNFELLLEEPEIEGSLDDVPNELEEGSETPEITVSVNSPVDTEYVMKVRDPEGETAILEQLNNFSGEREIDISYQQLLEIGGFGENTVRLEATPNYTDEPSSLDSAEIEVKKDNRERILQGLEYLPKPTFNETGITSTDFQLMREIAEEYGIENEIHRIVFPHNLEDSSSIEEADPIMESEAETFLFGHGIYVIKYDDPDEEEIQSKFLDHLEERREVEGLQLYTSAYGNIRFYDPENRVSVESFDNDDIQEAEERAEDVIKTLRGDTENMRGETRPPEGFRGHETTPPWNENSILDENTIITFSHSIAPAAHSNHEYEDVAYTSGLLGTVLTYDGNGDSRDAIWGGENLYDVLERDVQDVIKQWKGF